MIIEVKCSLLRLRVTLFYVTSSSVLVLLVFGPRFRETGSEDSGHDKRYSSRVTTEIFKEEDPK